MTRQTEKVREQVELESRAGEIVLAALNNEALMAQVRESYALETLGETGEPLAKVAEISPPRRDVEQA